MAWSAAIAAAGTAAADWVKDSVKREATHQAKEAVRQNSSMIGDGLAMGFDGVISIAIYGTVALTTTVIWYGPQIPQLLLGAMNPLGNVPGLGQLMSNPGSDSKATGQKVAEAALAWVDKDFNPGIQAQCAFFVRQVLKDAGVEVGIGQSKFWGVGEYPYEGLAGSFFADEIGTKIPISDLQPGDLVAFKDTYGNFPAGTITHIGVYVGDGMMVDRSTSSAPVRHRSIHTFGGDKLLYGVRPHTYAQLSSSVDDNFITLAIGNAEGTRTPDGGYNASYYGHTDPGNGASNIGSFSYQVHQGGASTPEQADALQLRRLNDALADAKAKGFNPESQAELVNFLDLWNQSPRAAEAFPARLQQAEAQGLRGNAAILKARVESFRNEYGAIDASGFGHSESRLRADQQRRMDAINKVMR